MPAKRSRPTTTTLATRLLRPRVLFTLSALLFLGVFAPYVPRLTPDLKNEASYQADLQAISISSGHEWVPADLLKESFPENGDPLLSLLEPDLSEKVAHRLQKHPWVLQVRRVSVERSGTVAADLEYRVPVAMVETAGGTYPIDAEGVLLPPRDFSPQDAERFPHVQNAKSAPPGEAGMAWDDPVVQGGARIAARLVPDGDRERIWKRFGLVGIVGPANLPAGAGVEQISFELVTAAGSRIVWGKAPGADALEPTFEQKIGRLQHYLATYGSFDKPQGPYSIDIRGFEAISLYPLDTKLYR